MDTIPTLKNDQVPGSLSVPAPQAGEHAVFPHQSGDIHFLFDITNADFARNGNDLVVKTDNGTSTVQDFFVAENADTLPNFVLEDGTEISGTDFLMAQAPDMDLSTAAGPTAAASGSLGSYSDTQGSLIDGVDRLGSLDKADSPSALRSEAANVMSSGQSSTPTADQAETAQTSPQEPGGKPTPTVYDASMIIDYRLADIDGLGQRLSFNTGNQEMDGARGTFGQVVFDPATGTAYYQADPTALAAAMENFANQHTSQLDAAQATLEHLNSSINDLYAQQQALWQPLNDLYEQVFSMDSDDQATMDSLWERIGQLQTSITESEEYQNLDLAINNTYEQIAHAQENVDRLEGEISRGPVLQDVIAYEDADGNTHYLRVILGDNTDTKVLENTGGTAVYSNDLSHLNDALAERSEVSISGDKLNFGLGEGDKYTYYSGLYAHGLEISNAYWDSDKTVNVTAKDAISIEAHGNSDGWDSSKGIYVSTNNSSEHGTTLNLTAGNNITINAGSTVGDYEFGILAQGAKNQVNLDAGQDGHDAVISIHEIIRENPQYAHGAISASNGSTASLTTHSGNDLIDIVGNVEGYLGGANSSYSVSMDTGSGNDTIRIAGNVQGTRIDAGSGNDVVQFNNSYVSSKASSTFIDGGTGDDTIKTGSLNVATLDAGKISLDGGAGDDRMEINGGISVGTTWRIPNNMTPWKDATSSVELAGGSGNDTMLINGNIQSLLQGAKVNIDLGSGNDYLAINGNLLYQTGDANYRDGDAKGISISGGEGNDRIVLNGKIASATFDINGGSGHDILELTASSLAEFKDRYAAWLQTSMRSASFEELYINCSNAMEAANILNYVNSIKNSNGFGSCQVSLSDNLELHSGSSQTVDASKAYTIIHDGDYTGSAANHGFTLGVKDDFVLIKGAVDTEHMNLGAGNDSMSIDGGLYHSTLDTGDGNDMLHIGHGLEDSTVNLGSGNDFIGITGGMFGNSQIYAGLGDDTVVVDRLGGNEAKTIDGGGGFDMFIYNNDAGHRLELSEDGHVRIDGQDNYSNTTITGFEGLGGGSGNDVVFGNSSNNLIYGGAGNDTLTGGGGDDTFTWKLGDQGEAGKPAIDTIMDFGNGNDKLDLRELLPHEAQENLSDYLQISNSGQGNITISINTEGHASQGMFDQVIVLENTSMSNDDLLQRIILST